MVCKKNNEGKITNVEECEVYSPGKGDHVELKKKWCEPAGDPTDTVSKPVNTFRGNVEVQERAKNMSKAEIEKMEAELITKPENLKLLKVALRIGPFKEEKWAKDLWNQITADEGKEDENIDSNTLKDASSLPALEDADREADDADNEQAKARGAKRGKEFAKRQVEAKERTAARVAAKREEKARNNPEEGDVNDDKKGGRRRRRGGRKSRRRKSKRKKKSKRRKSKRKKRSKRRKSRKKRSKRRRTKRRR